jgi:two-component sensor histidine kinase
LGNLAQVDLAAYAEKLVIQVLRSLQSRAGRIQVHRRLASIPLEIDQAVPCGLIINEFLTNSLKHAFPGDRAGEILIEARLVEARTVCLRMSDNGVGLPSGLDFAHLKSLGLQLISDLARQLGGQLRLEDGPGTAFEITFPLAGKA